MERAATLGLTGGTGSGKSAAAAVFERLGATVISADAVGHEVLRMDDVKRRLVEEFGPEVLNHDGEVARSVLGRKVFGDADALVRLNEIVHPPLLSLVRERMESERAKPGVPAVVVDAALITEWGIEDWFDLVLVVSAPEVVVRDRLAGRGLADDEIGRRIASQFPLERRLERAHEHIVNDGSLDRLEGDIERVWRRLRRVSAV